jgi:hypothetical protein
MSDLDGFAKLKLEAPIPIDRKALVDLLESAAALRQENTCVSGWIRVLAFNGAILVQEETPEGHALARRMPTIEQANEFVDRRLETYERMWDGCGCTIRYFD